ncbi:natural cytotoxicity triggering receptor 2-like [Myotis myotis]|uniref:natural cytotoxicity triggering receptor 2-like n=1 Tax=Myotis myotis TaxID=51298 RepID=UPI001747F847|nr:natural cytotoxicity triggering receptor 2-like [Myotis myotis]
MAWEAAHLLPLVLLVLLASGSWEQQPLLLRILEGEEVSIRCNYPGQQGWKTKTWCKVISAGTCTLLVTSPSLGRGPGNPRYVIRNYPRQGYFTVTMTALREDSGLYWCGFYEFSKVDILRTIRLAVSRAPTPSTARTTRTTGTTRTTRTTAGTLAISPVIDSPPGHSNVILSVMVVLLLLVVLALLVILYFWQRRRARAGEGKAHHIHGISTHEDETVHRTDPPARQRDSQLSWGSDQQLGSGKDTGDIHYASFTRLDPFGLEDPIYINTRPGLRPTPDPFLAVEYASIAKN